MTVGWSSKRTTNVLNWLRQREVQLVDRCSTFESVPGANHSICRHIHLFHELNIWTCEFKSWKHNTQEVNFAQLILAYHKIKVDSNYSQFHICFQWTWFWTASSPDWYAFLHFNARAPAWMNTSRHHNVYIYEVWPVFGRTSPDFAGQTLKTYSTLHSTSDQSRVPRQHTQLFIMSTMFYAAAWHDNRNWVLFSLSTSHIEIIVFSYDIGIMLVVISACVISEILWSSDVTHHT